MYLCVLLAVPLLFLGLAGSDDLYWRPNTDWSEPSNWDLGRVPIAGDVVDLSSVRSSHSFLSTTFNTHFTGSPWLCHKTG